MGIGYLAFLILFAVGRWQVGRVVMVIAVSVYLVTLAIRLTHTLRRTVAARRRRGKEPLG
jgi:hypothetical protein